MSDPARVAERRTQRAAVAAARAGDSDLVVDLLAAGQEIPETAVSQAPPAVTGTPIPASGGQQLVSSADFARLARQLEKTQEELARIEADLNKTQKATKQFIVAARRWMQTYGAAFTEFHSEASSTRDGLAIGLDGVARGLSGYMDGLNWGERPKDPTLLALAMGLEGLEAEGDPLLGSFSNVIGAALRYMAYRDPLTAGPSTGSPTLPPLS